MDKDYIKSGDFYCDGEEWIYFGASIDEFDFDEDEEYEDGDILNVWFLFNQSSPASLKFVVGLSELLSECYPGEHQVSETIETKLSPLAHKHILVRHGD